MESPAVGVGGELVAHVLAELPALGVLDARDRLFAAAWLASLRSARTRRPYDLRNRPKVPTDWRITAFST